MYKIKERDLIISDVDQNDYLKNFWLCRDLAEDVRKASIEGFVSNGDYFQNLLENLELIEEVTKNEGNSFIRERRRMKMAIQIERLKKEMLFLQKYYRIVGKGEILDGE